MCKYERVPMYVAVCCSIVEYSLTFMASSSAISFLSKEVMLCINTRGCLCMLQYIAV